MECNFEKSRLFPWGGTSLKASIPTKVSFQFSLSLNTPIINSLKDFKRPFDFKLMRIAKAEDSGNQRSTAIALKTHTQVFSIGCSNPSSPILRMRFALNCTGPPPERVPFPCPVKCTVNKRGQVWPMLSAAWTLKQKTFHKGKTAKKRGKCASLFFVL